MAAGPSKPELLVIVGPTASGKSELAMKIARQFNGEIIAADSRTVIKGLNIGTAKPTIEDRHQIKHWGLDLVSPGERFTAADFKKYAQIKIEEIKQRQKLPILVGGSGLYVDSVLYDFKFGPPADEQKRASLEKLEITELKKIIEKKSLVMPENDRNKRHLVRTIERAEQAPERGSEPRQDAVIVGLQLSDEVLRSNIDRRAKAMFRGGVLDETRRLIDSHPNVLPENVGLIYKICSEILTGQTSEPEGIKKFKQLDWQYARRQRTWFRRHPEIAWFDSPSAAEKYIRQALNT